MQYGKIDFNLNGRGEMAKFNGSDFLAQFVGTPNKTIADTRDLSISISDAEIDVSTRDSGGWKETLPGQRTWTDSLSGVVDYVQGANESGYQAIQDLAISRAAIQLKFGILATGGYAYTGSGYIMSADISATYEDAVTWTAEISGNGPLVAAVIA